MLKIVCWMCRANKTTLPYWETGKSAKLKGTRLTQTYFVDVILETGLDLLLLLLFGIPGLSLEYLCTRSATCMGFRVHRGLGQRVF